jgi:hypothetical protein
MFVVTNVVPNAFLKYTRYEIADGVPDWLYVKEKILLKTFNTELGLKIVVTALVA